MSYTFLLDAGVESSAECFSEISASVRSSWTHSAEKSCFKDSVTESCHASLFGTMCAPSMGVLGGESLTLSQEDSLAKESALQDREMALNTPKALCGENKRESLARFDQDMRLWKIRPSSSGAVARRSLAILPRWGMTVCGELYRVPMPSGLVAHRAWITSVSESGFSERLPTPTCADAKNNGNPSQKKRYNLNGRVGGRLNPAWVEWLMGWPIGWTDLKPLAMDRFQQWLSLHGKSSGATNKQRQNKLEKCP